jgi:hypothetical protein
MNNKKKIIYKVNNTSSGVPLINILSDKHRTVSIAQEYERFKISNIDRLNLLMIEK